MKTTKLESAPQGPEGGYFTVMRKDLERDIFKAKGPLTRREAYYWLLSNANYKDKTLVNGGTRVRIRRGQLMRSRKYLANAWGWSEKRVRCFLAALEKEGLIHIHGAPPKSENVIPMQPGVGARKGAWLKPSGSRRPTMVLTLVSPRELYDVVEIREAARSIDKGQKRGPLLIKNKGIIKDKSAESSNRSASAGARSGSSTGFQTLGNAFRFGFVN